VHTRLPTVLLVDDDPLVLDLVRESLQPESLYLARVEGGQEALSFCAQQRVDAVLLDVGLPDMDGFDVLRELKANPATAAIPVLALTARDDPEEIREGFLLGAADYVTKPFSMTVLRARLNAVLRTKRLLEELEQARVEAEQAARLKSRFLANMSQELHTPLHALIGMSDLLLRTGLSPDQAGMAQTIKLSGERLLLMIQSALDLLKLEAGGLELEALPFQLRPLVEETVALWQQVARERRIELEMLLAADLPERLMGDQGRFRLVLHQLLHAALKLARPGPVRVTIQAGGNHGLGAQPRATEGDRWPAHVAVVLAEATGLAAEQPESWFRAAASGSVADAEPELGLACARRLIEFMGGRMWVQKEGTHGMSLRFTVSLAAAKPATSPGDLHQPSAGETAKGPGSTISQVDRDLGARVPARILLVDDDAINRKVGARMLAKMGYQVDLATGAEEAIAAIRQTPYDLVFTDIQMPGMSGTEAAQLYRQADQAAGRSRLAPLMIIAMTANALPGDRERYLAAGMDEYIAKPVRPATLQEVILAWAQRRNQAAASLGQAPGTSPEPALEVSPVDLNRLNDLAFGNPAILKETVTLYLTETASRLARLRQAIVQQDVASVFSLAHSVIGSSATLGVALLIPPLRLLEERGRSGALGDASQLLNQVEQEFGRVRMALAEFVGDAPSPGG